ncbi:MAG: hypothetical protein Ct9H300mP14_07190 [Gammaproteobacteria bacterium]|nr:MAG: hypothetical protein Ct9H300mP14_07190 [Gammaproteobacteria bacterium]
MDHYSAICKSHPNSLPETFNFGRDVVDNMAEYGQDCSDLGQRPQHRTGTHFSGHRG